MSKAKGSPLKPGQKAPDSGQYAIVGPKGGNAGGEVTVTKGKSLPPTPKPGQFFVLVDPTRHKKGKSMPEKLADEIVAAYKGEGSAVKKRDDTHKMAESNKAFAHFRW